MNLNNNRFHYSTGLKHELKYQVANLSIIILPISKDDHRQGGVLRTGTVSPEDAHLIVDAMEWTINKESIHKPEMMMLEIIANNNWQRPIYFVSTGGDSDIGISDYLQFEGFAYRLVPIKTKASDFLSISRFNIDKLYRNYMEKFRWGRMNEPVFL